MRSSFNWLRELVQLPEGTDGAAAAAALTQQGLEVESIESRGRDLRGVLIAEVLSIAPHPNAEKLRIVRVRAGDRTEDVVCGAPNVPSAGHRVCWAAPGARLPSGTLDRREIRGVWSPGMLCGEDEMGLGPKGDGILVLPPSAPSGADLVSHLGIYDDIFEVNVTPNRPDALSHLGLARELAAFFGTHVSLPIVDSVPVTDDGPSAAVEVLDASACARYAARFITNVSVGLAPIAMRLRLAACGMRSVSNLVDVTNYVLLETGQPLHAFDFAKLQGGITVRRASAGEEMVTLDGQRRVLAAGDIVIADQAGPIALAGVMGGSTSEVSADTRHLLLEAAVFDPRSVRRTAKRLGLHSEASYRYERGVDASGIPYAAARAAALLASLGGGSLVRAEVDRYGAPVQPRKVSLSTRKLQRVTGASYVADFAAGKLRRLGMRCQVSTEGLVAEIPTYRPDVTIEEDLIEEILRMGEYGAAVEKTSVLSNARPQTNPEGPDDRARNLLAAAGLSEITTWAFVPRAALANIAGEPAAPALADGIVVKNPISADYEIMRTSLLPGLADVLRRNVARGMTEVALFEVGPVVWRAKGEEKVPSEPHFAAGILTGRQAGWLKAGEAVDFFDAKRIVSEVLRGFGILNPDYRAPGLAPFLHPGVSAEILVAPGGLVVGRIGELHPLVARRLGIDVRAFYFELSLGVLATAAAPARSVPPPRFPAVARDVSFWMDVDVPSARQSEGFASAREPLLREIAVREDFRDPRYTPAGKKGMLWSLTYRADDRTLTDGEVDAAHGRVVAALAGRHPLQIR